MADRLDRARIRALGCWLFGAVSSVLTILYALNSGKPADGIFVLGILVAGTLIAGAWISRDVRLAQTMVGVAWCASLGIWFPHWEAQAVAGLERWWPSTGLDPELLPRFVVPVSILGAGLVTAAVLYVPTRSARITAQTTLLTILLAGAPLAPSYPDVAVGVGAALWTLGLTGAVLGLAVFKIQLESGEVCAACRYDLSGLDGPCCPRCGGEIDARKSLVVPGTLVPRRVDEAA